MLDLDYVKNYLRVDADFDDMFIIDLINIVEIYVDACVGEGYKTNENMVRLSNLLKLKMIADMYSNRSGNIDTDTIRQDTIITTILDKLSNCGDVYV